MTDLSVGLGDDLFDDDEEPDDDPELGPVVYQPRCVFCGCEHYAVNVYFLSRGQSGCHRCGRVPPVYTSVAAYRQALRESRERREAAA